MLTELTYGNKVLVNVQFLSILQLIAMLIYTNDNILCEHLKFFLFLVILYFYYILFSQLNDMIFILYFGPTLVT
jgi:hypothetical protein